MSYMKYIALKFIICISIMIGYKRSSGTSGVENSSGELYIMHA